MYENRGRAWRRAQNRTKGRKDGTIPQKEWTPEKNWKLMYLRSAKLRRATQLGMEYPTRTVRQILDREQPQDEKA